MSLRAGEWGGFVKEAVVDVVENIVCLPQVSIASPCSDWLAHEVFWAESFVASLHLVKHINVFLETWIPYQRIWLNDGSYNVAVKLMDNDGSSIRKTYLYHPESLIVFLTDRLYMSGRLQVRCYYDAKILLLTTVSQVVTTNGIWVGGVCFDAECDAFLFTEA